MKLCKYLCKSLQTSGKILPWRFEIFLLTKTRQRKVSNNDSYEVTVCALKSHPGYATQYYES